MELGKKLVAFLLVMSAVSIASGNSPEPEAKGHPKSDLSESPPMVNPTFELAELIERFEKDYMTGEQKASLAAARAQWLNLKKSGYMRWGSENWMKDPNYYKSLSTSELVEECFSRAIFANEMAIYNEPWLGLTSLRIFHNGFAEFFQREDMWKGILHLYETLSAKLDPQADLIQIVNTAGHLDELRKLYVLSPLKEQVKEGRERIFLAANLRVLRKFKWYLENYDPEELGTDGSPGFFREPCSVAQVALMLAKQVDPHRYLQIEPVITRVQWTAEQNPADLSSFINLVITSLEAFVAEEDTKKLDEILGKGASPREPARTVSPTAEVDGLIELYERDRVEDVAKAAQLEEFEQKLKADLGDRIGRWKDWMREPQFFRDLDTTTLAKELFTFPKLASYFEDRMGMYNDRSLGLICLRYEHGGFGELFERKDMWKGILHANEHMSTKLISEEAIRAKGPCSRFAGALAALRVIYVRPPLKEQIKRRERLFLASTLRVLKRFKYVMDNYDDVYDLFYPEPVWVSQAALLFAKQVDPQKYAEVAPTITNVAFPAEQRIEDVLDFTNLVIESLDGFVSDEDYKKLDEIVSRGPAPSEPKAKNTDHESAEANKKVPVHPWHKELLDNMSAEDIKQSIRNLANFDDCHLAETSIAGWDSSDGCAEFQSRVVVRLMRVRRLLAYGRQHPEHVMPPLREALRDSLLAWPAAFNKHREDYAKGIHTYTKPDASMRAQKTCLAATYILAELQDHNALPLLAHQYRIHHPWPRPVFRAPVPPAITFYAMHRLAATHPREDLSPEAVKTLDEYLVMADCIAPPEEFTATAWGADYSESDPRLLITCKKKTVLRGQTTMALPRYPNQFKDGSDMQTSNGVKSKKMDALFAKLDAFILLAYPDANLPQPQNTPSHTQSPIPTEPNTAEDIRAKGFPKMSMARKTCYTQTAAQSTAEVVADLGNAMIKEYCYLERYGSIIAVPTDIEYYYTKIMPNMKVIRLIEEGRNDPDAVSSLLRDAVRQCLADYDKDLKAWNEARSRSEDAAGTSDADEYYNKYRKYECRQMEFWRIHDVAYMSLYILANIERLDVELLAGWIQKEKPQLYHCPDMDLWLVDAYFRQALQRRSDAAKKHAALTDGLEIANRKMIQSKWNASWDIHGHMFGMAKINPADIETIETLVIARELPVKLDQDTKSRILKNFVQHAEHPKPGSYEEALRDPATFASLGRQHEMIYTWANKYFGTEDLPEMYSLLNEDKHVDEWRFIAQLIGFVSDRGNRNSIDVLLKYLQRRDIWPDVKEDRVRAFDVGMGKILCLEWIGMVGGEYAEEILLKAIALEGAEELTKEWIGFTKVSYPGGREQATASIRGRAAMGLVFCQSAKGMEIVEQMYEHEKQKCVREGKQFSAMFNEMVSAMAYKALIDEHGLHGAFVLYGSEKHAEIISKYIKKYWLL